MMTAHLAIQKKPVPTLVLLALVFVQHVQQPQVHALHVLLHTNFNLHLVFLLVLVMALTLMKALYVPHVFLHAIHAQQIL